MLNIAVDGYSSSGKGGVCSRLAQRLGIVHFYTGAIYRAIGLYMYENNIDLHNQQLVCEQLSNIKITLDHDNGEQITYLNGRDVSVDIRSSIISDVCSIVSPYPVLREFVLNIQRSTAESMDLIMEGRDITSYVLPNADFKFFLDASLEVRAERRYEDFIKKGENVSFEKVKEDLRERDRRDTQRKHSPLILTEGTIHIDNSNMTIEEEVELMYKTIKGEI